MDPKIGMDDMEIAASRSKYPTLMTHLKALADRAGFEKGEKMRAIMRVEAAPQRGCTFSSRSELVGRANGTSSR